MHRICVNHCSARLSIVQNTIDEDMILLKVSYHNYSGLLCVWFIRMFDVYDNPSRTWITTAVKNIEYVASHMTTIVPDQKPALRFPYS